MKSDKCKIGEVLLPIEMVQQRERQSYSTFLLKMGLIVLLGLVTYLAPAQISYTVSTVPPLAPNNGAAGVTFEVESMQPVMITGLSCVMSTGATSASVWMRVGGVEHAPGQVDISVANGWSQEVIGASISGADNSSLIPVDFGTHTIQLQPNVRYAFISRGTPVIKPV